MLANIADIQFFSKSAVDPKYYVLHVNLLTSKTYTYPMKSRHLLAKNGTFLSWYSTKMAAHCKKWKELQVDLEFQQNEIKKLNKEYVVEVFISRLHVVKAYSKEKNERV